MKYTQFIREQFAIALAMNIDLIKREASFTEKLSASWSFTKRFNRGWRSL